MVEERADEYLQQIVRELERREQRVVALEEEERRLQFELAKHSVTRTAMRGSAFALRTADSYNRALRGELEKVRAALSEAREERNRAEERKRIREQELDAQGGVEHEG